jgi:two-component system, cell cycle sensor histidine kinase and response regulator CckA
MKTPLNVLLVEDSANDAELHMIELRRAGFDLECKRVETEPDFLAELKKLPDIILSDYSMPEFNGLRAAELLKKSGLNIPFILISGTVGEDVAVEAMKHGATDYLLKDRIARLGIAVERALEQKRLRDERDRVEEARRASEERYRTLFDYAPDGIVIADPNSYYLDANASICRMLGYTHDEFIRLHASDIVVQSEVEHIGPALSAIKVGSDYHREWQFRRKDDSVFTAEVIATAMPDGNLLGLIRDITERKRLEMQFIEAQKMEVIGHLASGVAHDFNNMLGVIIGYGDMMMVELDPNGLPHKCAEEIRQAAERAVGLTRQLLLFSRKQAVQTVVLDPNEVVTSMDKMLRRLIDENIELNFIPGNEIGQIKADSGQVGQVLMNLVVNARDAMPNGGKLTIETNNVALDEDYVRNHAGATVGDYVMLAVSDTGGGMSAEVKARLFEVFFTTKPKGKGTGLGLATCQTIVRQCGGHIEVQSESGKGTALKIYFPRVEQSVDMPTKPAAAAKPLARGTETLLLVEDEPSVRHLACSILESQGYNVLRANNGQEGLRVAREYKSDPISLVITDVIMPLMNGKVMAEWLKATYPEIKILYTSGYTDDAIAEHGVLEPGVAFLSKPYSPATLARKVRAMLDNETDTALLRKQNVTIHQNSPATK